jgi:hypothetical protein
MLKHYWWHISEAHAELENAKRSWATILKCVRKADKNVPRHNHNRKYVDAVVRSVDAAEYAAVLVGEGEYECTYDGMVALHQRVLDGGWDVLRCRTAYDEYITRAIQLEDVLAHAAGKQQLKKIKQSFSDFLFIPGHHVWYRSAVRWSFPTRRRRWWTTPLNTLESVWYRYLEQVSLKLIAVFFAMLSVLVIWTECTVFTERFNVDLSPFSLLLGSALTPFAVELIVWIPVTYITVCVFSSLFAIRVLHYYRFLPGGVTNARTLLMSASYMGRLVSNCIIITIFCFGHSFHQVPPLVYNYLLMIHCGPGLARTTAYSDLMGMMPLLGSTFTVFFPIVLIVLVLFVVTNLGSRILGLCRVKQFDFSESFDDENCSNGERVLRAEKAALERSWQLEEIVSDDDGEALVESPSNVFSEPKTTTTTSTSSSSSSTPTTSPSSDIKVDMPSILRLNTVEPMVERKGGHLPRAQAGLLRSLDQAQPGGEKRVGDGILDF